MGASVDGVEEDRIDELLELIWTLREEESLIWTTFLRRPRTLK